MLKKLRHVLNLPPIVHIFSKENSPMECLRFDFGVHSCIEKMTLTCTPFGFQFGLCVCVFGLCPHCDFKLPKLKHGKLVFEIRHKIMRSYTSNYFHAFG